MRETYFYELAKVITDSSVKRTIDYRVLLAKGKEKEWDDLCLEELNTRGRHLDNASKSQKKAYWEYATQFTARRSRYHARMDFIVITDVVFINSSTSKGLDEDRRGYIYIKDSKVADIFRKWFDAIWNDDDYSDPIGFRRNKDGSFEFLL